MLEKYAPFKVLNTLLDKPKAYSVRELANESKVEASTAKYCLDYFHSKNIVKLTKIGRTYQYNLNLDSILTRQIKILKSIDSLIDSGLVKKVTEKFPSVYSIVLYGSVARGEDDPKSDIDILIISRSKVRPGGIEVSASLKRELTILSYTTSEWKEKAKKNKVFYDRVILDGIALYGEIPKVD